MPKQTAQNTTAPTDADPSAFVDAIPDPRQRDDSRRLVDLMREVTGEEPVLWGPSIVGFGSYHYRYASGREGDTAAVGFAPRKGTLALYGLLAYEHDEAELRRLGEHKAGKGCLYIKRLSDVDLDVLREMIATAYAATRQE